MNHVDQEDVAVHIRVEGARGDVIEFRRHDLPCDSCPVGGAVLAVMLLHVFHSIDHGLIPDLLYLMVPGRVGDG